MNRVLKVCRSAIKETKLEIICIKDLGNEQGGSKKSNNTKEINHYNKIRKRNELTNLVGIITKVGGAH